MKLTQPIGIISYGTALPRLAVSYGEIASGQGKEDAALSCPSGIKQKTVPDLDEDAATLAVAASFEAVQRWGGDLEHIAALFVGSESHPYAVNPTGTVVQQALGLGNPMALADLEFACKAGTQGMQIGLSYVASGMTEVALAVGADTAQSKPGDALEFAASAGASAMLLGQDELLAEVTTTVSYATDTPDFWRRPGQNYPKHAGRFTGEPAYFHHVMSATEQLLAEAELTPANIDFCVFHTPNAKFPLRVAKKLGFSQEQVQPSLVVREIGNTYAAASLMALSAVLDQAPAEATILLTSYGSGAGADSFLLRTTPLLPQKRSQWQQQKTLNKTFISDKIAQLQQVPYNTYHRHTDGGAH